MSRLDLRLLGPPRVEAGGDALAFDTRKAVAILARLAVDGLQRRDTLASLLWPESDAGRARGALRRTLSVLRSGIDPDVLVIGRDDVALAPGAYRCDVDSFHELVAGVREHHGSSSAPCLDCLASLGRAVELHRGDFLEGFGLRDSTEFDDWQFFQAEALRVELAGTLDLLANALVQRAELTEATATLRRRLAIDPLHEPTHRRLMLVHAWSSRREESVRQYRECVTVLERELGVPPLETTTELYESILAGQAPPAPATSSPRTVEAPPGTAPTPAAGHGPSVSVPARADVLPMVGRGPQLDAVLAAHRSSVPDGRLITVEGESGVGKTRLLQEFVVAAESAGAAAVVVRCYPGEETLAYGPIADAIREAALGAAGGAVTPAWLSEVARLVPELLDRHPDLATPPPLGSPEADRRFFEGVRQTLVALGSTGQPAVLVVEDLQWADAASLDVITYLAHRLTAASLCLVLSWRTEAIGRDHPVRRLSTGPRDGAGVTHLVLGRLVGSDVAALVDAAGVGDVTDRLFRQTEGLPLFVVEYLHMLRSRPLDDDWDMPAGVRDLLSERIARLSETARQLLTSAAVIGRSFDLETLLHASGRDEDETVVALEELLRAEVVTEVLRTTGRGEVASYDFRHHMLRTVAYEEASIARRRLLHARTAEALTRRSRTSDAPTPLPLVAEHLRLAGRDDEAARTFVRAGDEARALAAHAEAVEHYRAALALGHPDAAALHEAMGDLLTLIGDYRTALHSYQAAAAHTDEVTDLARYEHRISAVHARRGDWPAAQVHLEASLAALPSDGDPGTRARLQAELGLVAHRRGATDEARRRVERSLELAESCGDALAAAQAHNLLGIISRSVGDSEATIGHLRRSLEAAEATDDPAPNIAALNNLALVHADLGELGAALELGKTALARCRVQGDRHHEAAILNNLADLLRAAGQDEEAMRHLKQAVTIFAEIGEPEGHEPAIWKLVDW